jgi:hypothetical protein
MLGQLIWLSQSVEPACTYEFAKPFCGQSAALPPSQVRRIRPSVGLIMSFDPFNQLIDIIMVRCLHELSKPFHRGVLHTVYDSEK